MAINRVRKAILDIKGRSMFNPANLKQAKPNSLSGPGFSQLGGQANGKQSLGKSSPNSSSSRVPDAPGGATKTNAAGKRAGGNDTTSLS